MTKIRVMLVDDSAVVRGLIARAFEADASIEVVANAGNGQVAIEMAGQHRPDVIILDIEMPVMDGLAALPELLRVVPKARVIMASTLTQRNAAISMQALSRGASDYVAKPSAQDRDGLEKFHRELLEKVRALGGGAAIQLSVPLAAPRVAASGAAAAMAPSLITPSAAPASSAIRLLPATSHPVYALAVASSTGGPQALFTFFEGLKGKLTRIPAFVTQHMPPAFTALLAEQIGRSGEHLCAEAKEGEAVQPGSVYVAPGDYHMTPEKTAGGVMIRLNQNPPENFCRPAADPMLRALAEIYGPGLLTVVLTGMGQDGCAGAKVAVERGGAVLAQDQATSVVWGMPGAVAEAGLCQAVLPLSELAPAVIARCGG